MKPLTAEITKSLTVTGSPHKASNDLFAFLSKALYSAAENDLSCAVLRLRLGKRQKAMFDMEFAKLSKSVINMEDPAERIALGFGVNLEVRVNGEYCGHIFLEDYNDESAD